MAAQEAPDYGTHPNSELEYPRSPAYLVFASFPSAVGDVVAFGPGEYETARKYAEGLRGLVVKVPVMADYS